MIVYCITNDVPGYEDVFYVGSTTDMQRRQKQHLSKPTVRGTEKSWRNFRATYGTHTLTFWVLHECQDEGELDLKEFETHCLFKQLGFKTWGSPMSTRLSANFYRYARRG